jgi:hypothetical protein
MFADFDLPDEVAIPLVIVISVVVFGLLLVGGFLVARDTIRGRGGWGINRQPLFCPRCEAYPPFVRLPRNLNQMLWGGCTCEDCGTEYDKWGREIASPAEEKETLES